MTAVTISGTFSKDERPNNGLERIADDLIRNQLGRHVVVGIVQFAGATIPGPGEPLSPRVKFLAIEPLCDDAAEQGRQMLDQARKLVNLGPVAETLFDAVADVDDRPGADPGPHPAAGNLPGADEPTIPGVDPDDGPVSERRRDEWLDGPK
ncbi:hypothetical protein [Micromonospora aurantiaca (nom. illeg.)]|uniref:hypothetical protein n=1 Tax=Micromonospora aurantiaca (nom. illeg.) TaxID=47850 RepID=UPI003F49EB0A